MAVLYSNNFDAEANGALTGWTVVAGAQLVVSNINDAGGTPVQGTKHYGQSSSGDSVRWEAGGALTNQAIRIAQKYSANGSSVAAFLRVHATLGDRGVLMEYGASGGNLRGSVTVRDNGTVSQAQSAYNIPVVVGDLVHLEARVVGNDYELRIWTNSNPRPSTATVSHTSTLWTAGRAGLRKAGAAFEFAACDQLVITDAAGGEDFFYAPDNTAPVLSSPTGTQTGANTASGTVSTNEGNGTLFRLASTNATESVATIKAAALTQAVTATGVQNVTFSGLTQNTTYFAHYIHTDAANNDSAAVSSASFTTAAGGDTTAPVLTGSITIGTVTSTSIQMSWPAGSDNVGIAGYDVSSNGGTSYTQLGNVLTHTFTGLTASTAYQLRVRARDAAGNLSTPVLSASQSTSAPPTATLTIDLTNNTNSAAAVALTAIPKVAVLRHSDMTLALALAGPTTNASGQLVISNAALVQGTAYSTLMVNADGTQGAWHYGVAT